jgi:hypothetical protein
MTRRATPRNPLLPHNRPKRGKHLVTPTNEAMVMLHAGRGLPQRQIATLLGIDVGTLIKNYRQQLDLGLAHTSVLVGKAAVDQATSGNSVAATFKWGEKFMDWGVQKDASASGPVSVIIHTGIYREGDDQKMVSLTPDREVVEHDTKESVGGDASARRPARRLGR